MSSRRIIVDDIDKHFLSDYKWRIYKSYSTYYATTVIDGKTTYLHRLIMGSPKGIEIDHKDRNGLNNSRSNLRLANHSQNNANKVHRNKWGYKGVVYYSNVNKFTASVHKDKVRYFLGYFNTPKEAALAYNVWAKKLHGEFAWLNKI
jgi:hypothetical protein